MLLWRQVAHLSPPLILICQWRLSWRRRQGQREEDWGVFAPLLLHYGVIPLLKRKIRSSLNYLKPILHFTCLTGWRWGEVGRSQDRENLNKSIHAETLWPFNQLFFLFFFKEVYSILHTEWWMEEGLSTFSVPFLLTTLLMNEPLIDRCDTYQHVVSHGLTSWHGNWTAAICLGQLFSINRTVRRQSFKTALLCSNKQTTCWYCC